MSPQAITRRQLLRSAAATIPLAALTHPARADLVHSLPAARLRMMLGPRDQPVPMAELPHTAVAVTGALQMAQLRNVTEVLLGLNEDSMIQPFRQMAGRPAPGVSLGGWYEYVPDYDHHHSPNGLAPAHSFGQWISALARLYAMSTLSPDTANPALRAKVLRLTELLATEITPQFFVKTRFPSYTLDKLICGLLDAHLYVSDPLAFATLDRCVAAALPVLPGHAIEREVQWKTGYDISWTWDENYTLPENLYRASDLVARVGQGISSCLRYRGLADAYRMDESFFQPLAENRNVLADLHAYSHVNALCSAAQCYLTTGSPMHLAAAVNGFAFLQEQSYATGGWGPEETLRKPGLSDFVHSLSSTHNSFETPCGAYAHLKLTRALLRATHDGRYGDSMERVFFNTILGALPLQPNGRAYYHSDYNLVARRVYSTSRWPCCSGTLPQAIADYGINTYLQSGDGLWVNLYQPSQLRTEFSQTPVLVTQTTEYPYDPTVHILISPSHPIRFTLHLRIPAWTVQPTLQINGIVNEIVAERGFTAVTRTWRGNDRLSLTLPATLRLEALPRNGYLAPATDPPQNFCALLYGPIALFALRTEEDLSRPAPMPAPAPYTPLSTPQPAALQLPGAAVLASQRTSPREWTVTSPTCPPVRFVPFCELEDQTYTLYFDVT